MRNCLADELLDVCSSRHRSPWMIPSRTVFNHRKWIYIEFAITRAHSGHGPLVYQPPSAHQRQCFPHFIPLLRASAPSSTLPAAPFRPSTTPVSLHLALDEDVIGYSYPATSISSCSLNLFRCSPFCYLFFFIHCISLGLRFPCFFILIFLSLQEKRNFIL